MDVERIEFLLRVGPPDQGRYEQVLPAATASRPSIVRAVGIARVRPRPGRTLAALQVSMAALIVLGLASATLLLRSAPSVGDGTPSPSASATSSPSTTPRSLPVSPFERAIAAWETEAGVDSAVGVFIDGRIFDGEMGIHPNSGLIRIGPVSRLYLAAVVLQLVDEGALSLDAPVAAFIGDWPDGDAITVRMLLAGSSGVAPFGEPLEALEARIAEDPDRAWSPADGLQIARAAPPRFEPGARFEPVDTDDALLAVIVEEVTGASASAEIRRRFIDPLRLTGTFAAGEPVPVAGSASGIVSGTFEMWRGYVSAGAGGGEVQVDDLDADLLAVLGPARGIAAASTNVTRWSDLLHTEPGLLSDTSRDLLGRSYENGGFGGQASCPCTDGAPRALVIAGSVGAYAALRAWFPEDGTSIVILTNHSVRRESLLDYLERIHSLIPPLP